MEPKSTSQESWQLQPGFTLADRYLIQSVIGMGGMGAVYRACDLHFPNVVKLVAVKEMINQAHDPVVRQTIVQNFEREANLLATLDHPAIPRIYDYFTSNERSYLILEYIKGKDLEAILNESEEPLQEERVIPWAIEICDVLNYLHSHSPEPIIFRDMKPSNVMINQHNHVVLVDFGIAKQFQIGQKGTMIGTEGYSPPEQYRGEASHLADIYALGATLHHLLCKRDPRLEPPFSFGERPLRKINPAISAGLEAIINTALQYSPEERYPSTQMMKEALLKVAQENGMLPILPSNMTKILDSEEMAKPIWTFHCQDEIRGSAMCYGTTIFVGSYDKHLYALNAQNGELIWEYSAEGGIVSRPAYHEGNIYFGSEDTRLHVVTSRYGRINWTYYTNGPVRSSPTIVEGHVFIGSDDGFLHAVHLNSGRRTWMVEAGSAIRSTPMVEHDKVYFGTESGDFYCLDFKGNIKWRFKAKRAITSSPVILDNVVYFGSLDGTLYALDSGSGWVIWRFRLGKGTISTPCVSADLIFMGAIDGVIYCIDTRTAKEVWRYTTDHQVTGSPILYKEAIYCGSVDGHLYCLDCSTGRLRWKLRTEGPITATPTVWNDMVFIGSTDHTLYALKA